MKINKNNLYSFIQSQLKEQCYVGLHGIADVSDLSNQYSNLSKEEKANSILTNGLINARGTTIGLTVRNFGDLNDSNLEKINDFNNYGFYSPSGKETIMVIAIPYFFEDSNGKKLFGGFKEYNSKNNNNAECITDYLFRNNIPPEMIMGYYSYDKGADTVDYIENPKYYANLSQSEKDVFIRKTFPPQLSYDVNNEETMERIREYGIIESAQKTAMQYDAIMGSNIGKSIETLDDNVEYSSDPELDLAKKLDEFLSHQDSNKYINQELLNQLLVNIQQDPKFLEWIEYKKEEFLLSSPEFKNQDYLLTYKNVPFNVLVENTKLNNGNNNLLNSFMALPIYCYPTPVLSTDDKDADLKFIYKVACGNDQYIVAEGSIKESTLKGLLQEVLIKIEKLKQEKGNVTEEERKAIFDRIIGNYGIANPVSFDAGTFVSDYEAFKQDFMSKNGVSIQDMNKDGKSNWLLVGYQLIDNRKIKNGKQVLLEEQVLQNRNLSIQNDNLDKTISIEAGFDLTSWFKQFAMLLKKNRKLKEEIIIYSNKVDDINSIEQADEMLRQTFGNIGLPTNSKEMVSLLSELEKQNNELNSEISSLLSKEADNPVSNSIDFDFTEIKHTNQKVDEDKSRIIDLRYRVRSILGEKVKNVELTNELIQKTDKISIDEFRSLFKSLTNMPNINDRKAIDNIWNQNEDMQRELVGYSIDELDSIDIGDIDTNRIKNNFETIVLNNLGIKDLLISQGLYDRRTRNWNQVAPPLSETYGFDISKYNISNYRDAMQMIKDFEIFLGSQGFNKVQIEQLYREMYKKAPSLCLDMFLSDLPLKQEYAQTYNYKFERKMPNYTIDQLNSISLADIDLSRLVPNFDIVFNSKLAEKFDITKCCILYRAISDRHILGVKAIENYEDNIELLHKNGYSDNEILKMCQEAYTKYKKDFDNDFISIIRTNQFSNMMQPIENNQIASQPINFSL